MKLTTFLISILLAGMVLTGLTTFLTSGVDRYDVNITQFNESFNNTMSNIETQKQLSVNIESNITKMTMREGAASYLIPYDMTKVAVNILKLSLNSVITVKSMLTESGDATTESGIAIKEINTWIIASIGAIIVIIFGILIVQAFLKWKLQS